MGKLVVTEFVSLDGVFEDPGGAEGYEHGGWTFEYDRGEDGGKFKLDEVMEAEVQLLGRVTYEGFAAAWPSMNDEAGFADRMNSLPKYVVSTTLTDLSWNNSRLIKGDVAAEVRKLKEQPGEDILVGGSATLVQTLMQENLVDRYDLMVFPIVVGKGKRLFKDGSENTVLKLSATKTFNSGVVVLSYEPERK